VSPACSSREGIVECFICFICFIFRGQLKIAEVLSRFSSQAKFISAVEKMGFKLKGKVRDAAS